MKPSTLIWAKFESKGKPQDTELHNLPTREVIIKLAEWTLRVPMGSYMRITFARTQAELEQASTPYGRAAVEPESDMMEELRLLLEQDTLGLEEPN
jgi:hypothetical protein